MAKKISWVLLYLVSFVPAGLSLYYFSENNLLWALISTLVVMSIYTLLIIKDLKFLSSISFFTMLFVSLLMISLAGHKTDNIFSSLFDEKAFMLTQPLLTLFLLVNSIFWASTKQGFKKITARVLISLFVLMIATYGANSPIFYQNFVYTRINILILLLFGIFLIIQKKKLMGTLNILLAIGILFLSASMFSEKAYTLEDEEKNEVIAYIDPIVKEMYGYYNDKDYNNFCKYCGSNISNLMSQDPISIKDKRELSGPYTHLDEPSGVIRKSGRFYVEYPIKFQKVPEQMYLTLVIENISSDPSIYGYSLSSEQGLHTSTGNENERGR